MLSPKNVLFTTATLETKWADFHLTKWVSDQDRAGVSFWGPLRSTLQSMIFYNSLKDVRLLAQTVY
jgi:hypothetical protein